MGERTLVTAGATSNRKYVRTSAPTKASDIYVVLNEGGTVAGTLSGSFIDEKFKKNNFILTNSEGTELVVPQSGNLGVKMSEVPEGAYVEITYKGKSPMKSGNFKGTLAHNWLVQYEQI
jgi:hypothetical protein